MSGLTTPIAGILFVVLYVAAFMTGIEVGTSDEDILSYYGDSGHRAMEFVAFFLIAAAALCLMVFANGLRARIAALSPGSSLAALALAGGVSAGTLVLAGDAISRATASAAMDAEFTLDPNTRRVFENAGFLLFVAGALAATLLVVAVSLAAMQYGVLPRWAAWTGLVTAALLPLAIVFIGFLVLLVWVLATSVALLMVRADQGTDMWEPSNVSAPIS